MRAKLSAFSPRFFLEIESEGEAEIILPPEDSHHASHVLRLRQGDRCEVVTSSGRVYAAAVVSAVEPVRVRLDMDMNEAEAGASYRAQVGIVQALARPAAVDYLVEKGTEVGASFFLLVRADGSPPARRENAADAGSEARRIVRWRRIAREAAKQSKQTALPWVDSATSVEAAIQRLAAEGITSVILHPAAAAALSDSLHDGADGHAPSSPGGPQLRSETGYRIALWVGPEGGWTAAEMEAFLAAGIRVARLGRGVLRTETAGPVAVALTRLVLGDW
ncbi:MAG TPA: RsmE family RNA methyltransferase [Thermoleophilia bacterium]|nr:RsmE family RNA methyltransferase [Thermoleophilia bacterium]